MNNSSLCLSCIRKFKIINSDIRIQGYHVKVLYEYNDLNDLLLSIRKSVENARKDRKNNNYQDFSKHTFELIVKMVSLIEYI